jgi:hypothetical protein
MIFARINDREHRFCAVTGRYKRHQGVMLSPPQFSGATSAMDWVNVQWCPAESVTLYWRSPNGMSTGGLTITAPAERALS